MPSADLVTVIGLGLDVVGVALLFWVAPEKYPDPQFGVAFAIEGNARKKWQKAQKQRGWLAKASLVCIIVGFILQGVAIAIR